MIEMGKGSCITIGEPNIFDHQLLHYTINDLDNAIYEIDMFDPMTFFDVERKLAPIIKRGPKKGEDK